MQFKIGNNGMNDVTNYSMNDFLRLWKFKLGEIECKLVEWIFGGFLKESLK